MTLRTILACLALAPLAGCAANSGVAFVPSAKSPVELRAIQTRTVDGDENTVMRSVIATLHDLGYRITKAEPEAGTVSATRLTGLRLAAVVQPRGPGQSAIRANATVLSPGREAQVDDPRFYQQNFFAPLAATMGRDLQTAPEDERLPEAVRPTAEMLPADRRAATGSPAATQPDAAAPSGPAQPTSVQ